MSLHNTAAHTAHSINSQHGPHNSDSEDTSKELTCIDTCNLDGSGMNQYKEAMEVNKLPFCRCEKDSSVNPYIGYGIVLAVLLIGCFFLIKFS